jgi:hypothetical protein
MAFKLPSPRRYPQPNGRIKGAVLLAIASGGRIQDEMKVIPPPKN